MRSQYIDLQGAFVHVPNSNWFHPQGLLICSVSVSCQQLLSSGFYYIQPCSECWEEDLKAWAIILVRLLDRVWLGHHWRRVETVERSLRFPSIWWHPWPTRGTRAELPSHSLMKPRWIIWHSLELRECSNWKPQSTELIAIPACVKPSDWSAIKKSNWFSTFVLSFRLK